MTMHNDSGKQHYLVIDKLRVHEAPRICAQNDIEYQALYIGTVWQPQLENSPIWIKTSPDDVIWQKWSNDPLWASSGVVFEFDSSVSEDDMMTTLKNNITIRSVDERLLFFRFYSPRVLSLIVSKLEGGNLASLCGAANCIQLSPLVSELYHMDKIDNPSNEKTITPLIISAELAEELLS